LTRAIIDIDSDEPVVVLVIPLRRSAQRTTPPIRRVIDTTAEPVVDNVVPIRQAVA
jgi:hypothetical protein